MFSLALLAAFCSIDGRSGQMVMLNAGIPVTLVVERTLESESESEGSPIPCIVAQDVYDRRGNVLIAKGATAVGVVTRVRSQDFRKSVLNQPARLEGKFVTVVATDGHPITICTSLPDPELPYRFTRENTRPEIATEEIHNLRLSPGQMVALESQLICGQADPRTIVSESSFKQLSMFADRHWIPGLTTITRQAQGNRLNDLLDRVERHDFLSELNREVCDGNVDPINLLNLNKVQERVSDEMSSFFHGRNITVYIGTPIQAYVAQSTTIGVGPHKGSPSK